MSTRVHYMLSVSVDLLRLGVWLYMFVGLLCLLQGCVALEFGFVSLGLHCFLRLSHSLYRHSGRCLACVAFSAQYYMLRSCSWQLPASSPDHQPSAGCDNVPPPNEGSLRLRGGFGTPCDAIHTGFVEIFHDEEWGAICNGDSGIEVAPDVICRQLGFIHGTGVNPLGNPADTDADYYFYSDRAVEESEEPLARFWLSSLAIFCNGPERRLVDCDLGNGFLPDANAQGPCSSPRNQARLTVACRSFPVTAALENVTTPGAGVFLVQCLRRELS